MEHIPNLSLDEKLVLITGKGAWHTNDLNGRIPSLHLSDGPHGLRIPLSDGIKENNNSKPSTCYPTASAIACSWDRELVMKMAHALAQEARIAKVSVVLGPGVNIKRSPLCGRNFEYYSEDPYLSGELGTAYVKAMQELSVGTSLKHFAANSQETHRQTSNSEIDERALREIYLAAFEAVVKQAKPYTIMASYNRINGIYACENKHLLTDILRNEWNFDGAIISDWGACTRLPECLLAGMDLEMPGSQNIHISKLRKAINENNFPIKALDRAVENINNLIIKTTTPTPLEAEAIDYHKLACEIASESAVLLKNDGMLPLKPCKVLIVGDLAVNMRYQGGGSSHITPIATDNAVDSLKEYGFDILYAKGYESLSDTISKQLEEECIRLARLGLPILFFGGLTDSYEGEGYDRKTLAIPNNQLHLLERILQFNTNISFICFGGSPMDLGFSKQIRSILHMYLGGEGVGNACAQLISGQKNPCGKLAETYPYSITDIPCYTTFGHESDDIEYRESIFVGYRYYDTYHVPVMYCFGHGLSYTQFEYSNMQIHTDDSDSSEYNGNGTLTISCNVTNTGLYAGKEIIQLYIENPKSFYLRPHKELRQFTKIYLEPNETKEISLILNKRSFCIYDDISGKFLMPSGDYKIHLAASINDIRLSACIHISGENYIRDDTALLKEYFNPPKGIFDISKEQFSRLYQHTLSNFDSLPRGSFSTCNSLSQLSKHSFLGKFTLFISKRICRRMYKGKSHNSPEFLMMINGVEDGTIDSLICQSEGMIPYKLAEAIVLSANNHHIKAIAKLIRG